MCMKTMLLAVLPWRERTSHPCFSIIPIVEINGTLLWIAPSLRTSAHVEVMYAFSRIKEAQLFMGCICG